ncbi:ROK family protein [Paenibacillus sp. GCM10012306]|uniref:ROK family protein n=1 Tax=Paenibacillus sp. GCM10012306 TaxID=3317342 RepID=UPI00360B7C65
MKEVCKISQITNNSIRVKKINQELIKQALKMMKQGTKSMIASATGLSVATCGNILNEFLETGEVIETEMEQPNGGRPAKRFIYNSNFAYIACIYISAEGDQHSLTYRVANLAGEQVDAGFHAVELADVTVIEQVIESLISKHPEIKAVGIGIPGLVHQGVINVCDIDELINVPLESRLKEKYEIEVTVDNDMNLTVYGFYKKQDYEEDKTIVVVTFPRNNFPGSGMMIDGYIHRGTTQFAGEVSFLPFGISRQEQFARLHQQDTFVSLAATTIMSLIAVINPETIALTGDLAKEEHIEGIYQRCSGVIPDEHMPQIIVLDQPHEHYMNGLIAVTLESLSYNLQLVERRR